MPYTDTIFDLVRKRGFVKSEGFYKFGKMLPFKCIFPPSHQQVICYLPETISQTLISAVQRSPTYLCYRLPTHMYTHTHACSQMDRVHVLRHQKKVACTRAHTHIQYTLSPMSTHAQIKHDKHKWLLHLFVCSVLFFVFLFFLHSLLALTEDSKR